jgi:hypothetical protein
VSTGPPQSRPGPCPAAAFDVFGDGKTPLNVSSGRQVNYHMTAMASPKNAGGSETVFEIRLVS